MNKNNSNGKAELKEDIVVLCTVTRIEGTTVFLDVEYNSHKVEGTMIFSEVSPGRIRNIREFVVPNKKVVCKVLRLRDGHPELSLRRVSAKEREELMDKFKKAQILSNILKPILKDKTPQVLQKIKESYELADFLDEVRENSKLIEQFVSKKESEELAKIFSEKKETEKEVKTEVKVSSLADSGIYDIQKVLAIPNARIHYLGSSRFSITMKASDYKTANHSMQAALENLKATAKKHNIKLELKEK